jgi:hypothetical protein
MGRSHHHVPGTAGKPMRILSIGAPLMFVIINNELSQRKVGVVRVFSNKSSVKKFVMKNS